VRAAVRTNKPPNRLHGGRRCGTPESRVVARTATHGLYQVASSVIARSVPPRRRISRRARSPPTVSRLPPLPPVRGRRGTGGKKHAVDNGRALNCARNGLINSMDETERQTDGRMKGRGRAACVRTAGARHMRRPNNETDHTPFSCRHRSHYLQLRIIYLHPSRLLSVCQSVRITQ